MGRFWGPDTCYFLHPPLSAVDSHYFRGKTPEVKKTFIFGECEVFNQSRQDNWNGEDGGGSGTGDVVLRPTAVSSAQAFSASPRLK